MPSLLFVKSAIENLHLPEPERPTGEVAAMLLTYLSAEMASDAG